MNITLLALMDTGTFDNMYLRPYEVRDSVRCLNGLQEATRYGSNVTATALSGAVGEILRPSSKPVAVATMANGWNNRRLRFYMMVQTQDLVAGTMEQYISGYTDHPGATLSGAIDPNMRMYVTNVIRMKNVLTVTQMGRQTMQSVQDANHVMKQSFVPTVQNFNDTAVNLQRPEDLFTTLQTSDYRRFSTSLLDPRQTFIQERAKLSSRSNASAPKYLSKILSAGQNCFAEADPNDGASVTWGRAEGMVRETKLTEMEPLFELQRKTSFAEGDSFTFSELEGLCPHLQSVTKYFPETQMARQQQENMPKLPLYQAGQFDGWAGEGNETIWATILAAAVPPVMLECMLKGCSFRVHNHTLDGSIRLDFHGASPLTNSMPLQTLTEHFKVKFLTEVLKDLLAGSLAHYDINCYFDVLGESRLEISIEGKPAVPYASPSFADALFSPVLTLGQQSLVKLANNIEFFTENLAGDTVYSATPYKQLGPAQFDQQQMTHTAPKPFTQIITPSATTHEGVNSNAPSHNSL